MGKPSIEKEQTVSFLCLRLFWAESKLTKKNRGKEAPFHCIVTSRILGKFMSYTRANVMVSQEFPLCPVFKVEEVYKLDEDLHKIPAN